MVKHDPKPQRAPKRKKVRKLSKKNQTDAHQRVSTHSSMTRRKKQEKGKEKENEVYLNIIDSGISLPTIGEPSQYDRESPPDRKTEIIEWDSPLKPRLGENPEVRCRFAESTRAAIIEYIGGEVWYDSVEYFFGHVLPPIRPEFDIDQILKQCIEDGALNYNKRSKKYWWKDFPSSSVRGKMHETKVYNKPLGNIFDAITNAASKIERSRNMKPTGRLHTDGNRATWSMKGSDIKPDGHIFKDSKDDNYPKILKGKHWYNVAFSFHFKKSENSPDDRYENTEHMIHSLQHCMAIDLYRRFTLGATIQGTLVRLWFYSRSTIICSEEFDFCSEPRTMVALVLSLLYASTDELGWDPTIEAKYVGRRDLKCYSTKNKKCDNGRQSIVLEIDGKQFKTDSSQVLSDTKANGIYTSATRVYKAFRIEDEYEKEPVIIKDYWPGEMYDTEDVIRQRIVDDIRDESEKEIVRNYTLTPIASGRVKVGDCDDHTEQTILRGKGPTMRYKIVLPVKKCGSKTQTTNEEFAGYGEVVDGQDREVVRKIEGNRSESHIHRWHYRIAYKEHAIPYHKLRCLDDMFHVLLCAVEVLLVIHKVGWVHRDLSPNNLYLYIDPISGEKRGLVGDLEFAKKAGTRGRCDFRTGTSNFMAIEILMKKYHFTSQKPNLVPGTQTSSGENEYEKIVNDVLAFEDEDEDEVECGRSITHTGYNKQRVRANYLHDIESIFWIAVWTLFNLQEDSQVNALPNRIEEERRYQRHISGLLFSGIMCYEERRAFLCDDDTFDNCLRHTSKQMMRLKALITVIRRLLLVSYEKAGVKTDKPILPAVENSVHSHTLQYLEKAWLHKNKARSLQRRPENSVYEGYSKRTTYDSRDDEEQPKKIQNSLAPLSNQNRRMTRSLTNLSSSMAPTLMQHQ